MPSVHDKFDFRVLRQNRRIVKDDNGGASRQEQLEEFHQVLQNISEGQATQRVRDFIVASFLRGARSCKGTVDNVGLEGSTAVFTKRRFRDKWNRALLKKISTTKAHSLRVKAKIRAKGARGQHWFNDRKCDWVRKRARTQNLWILHMAGDWHPSFETERPSANPHMMRVMLTNNLDVEQRFANGASVSAEQFYLFIIAQ